MARLPYSNFHDMNLDWVLKQIKTAYTRDNPPPYPVKSVNGMTGNVTVTGDVIPIAPNNSDKVSDVLREKQDAPASPGTPGQVLGLNANQTPVWIDQTGGVTSYDELTGIPSINGVPLSGEMEGTDLGLIDAPSVPGTAGQVLTSDGQGGQSWQTPATPPAPGAGDYAPIIMDSASGPVASFPDGAEGLYMPSLVAEIVPIQAGTGDPSPNNIRSITGRGGVTVYKTGINLWDEEWELGIYDISTGNKVANNSNIRNKDLIPVSPNTTYTWYNASSNVIRFVYYDVNKNRISSVSTTKSGNTYSFTTPANCFYMAFYYGATEYNNDVSVNYPASDTAYHAYQGIEPILEAWGDVAGNIYGGTIDIVSGVLTVTHDILLFPALTWVINSSLNGQPAFYSLNFPGKWPSSSSRPANILSSNYKTVTADQLYSQATTDGVISLNGSGAIQLRDFSVSTVSEFLSNNANTQLVYEKQNPQTYQLTPQQVQTILGRNNIYSDSGNCSVTYRADTKLFILKVIA